MTTASQMGPPTVAVRGAVQKTFVDAKVLAGFMDEAHVQQSLGDYFQELSHSDLVDARAKIAAARQAAAQFTLSRNTSAVPRSITHPYVAQLLLTPEFKQIFAQRPYTFQYLDPKILIASQIYVEPRADPVPASEQELLEFAFPMKWDVPAEISFMPPAGPFSILSSDPVMHGNVQIQADALSGTISISPPKHANLIQVVSYNGRYFLMNGYHRVYDCLVAGRTEVPALVISGMAPGDVQLQGDVFNLGVTLGHRPPLVADFLSPAAVDVRRRERRYGVIVNLASNRLASASKRVINHAKGNVEIRMDCSFDSRCCGCGREPAFAECAYEGCANYFLPLNANEWCARHRPPRGVEWERSVGGEKIRSIHTSFLQELRHSCSESHQRWWPRPSYWVGREIWTRVSGSLELFRVESQSEERMMHGKACPASKLGTLEEEWQPRTISVRDFESFREPVFAFGDRRYLPSALEHGE